MGHSVVAYERINKQLNYEGYGLIRYHFRRLPVEHDRGPADRLPGPHQYGRPHHCWRSRPHLSPSALWLPRRLLCSRSFLTSSRDGIFFLSIASHQIKIRNQSRNKNIQKQKKKKKKKKKNSKKKKKKKKKKKS